MRSETEHRLELTDEVKGRDTHFAGELRDGRRRLAVFTEEITGANQAAKSFVAQQHGLECSSPI